MTHQQAAVQAAAAANSRCVMNFEHFIKKEMEPQDYDILLPYFKMRYSVSYTHLTLPTIA